MKDFGDGPLYDEIAGRGNSRCLVESKRGVSSSSPPKGGQGSVIASGAAAEIATNHDDCNAMVWRYHRHPKTPTAKLA
eukprot:CAMPEP_0171911324 /NCGR_PEP_ID=MMETSP0993-20121228/10171_1 /TAXON_ID=483369 /ORGANISM="non described non described, Strain CCMP2098" /LENGTH=77 /DNA_ID=CAMNT_0012544779 /DNA_START=25 /DNA_END=254 /DNA_ORIENTATION=+